MPIVRVVYVCPHNGEVRICGTCGLRQRHRREELLPEFTRRRPRCDVHDVDLVRV